MVHCVGTTRFHRGSSRPPVRPPAYGLAELVQGEDRMRSEELLCVSDGCLTLRLAPKRVILLPI